MRRAALPIGFAIVVTTGSAVLMRQMVSVATEVPAPVAAAEDVLPPPAVSHDAAHSAGHPAPTYVRAIESDAVYAPRVEKAVLTHKVEEKTAEVSLPKGVERFDQCTGNCDSRDPMIARANDARMPIAPPPVAAVAPSEEGKSLFSLPEWADGGKMIDHAKDAVVSASNEAVGTVKQAVSTATTFATDLIR